MLANITLYKTKITRTDTMYFASPIEQTNFFNNFTEKLVIENISYNGTRAVRLDGFSWAQLFNNYNYCKIVFNNLTVYGFIDNFVFVNDECSDVIISPDLFQTFMWDIKFTDTMTENRTVPNKEFSKYIPYSNKMTPQDFETIVMGKLKSFENGTRTYGYLLVNIDASADPYFEFLTAVFRPTDNGLANNLYTIIIPIDYDNATNTFSNVGQRQWGIGATTPTYVNASAFFPQLMKKLPSASIVGVGIKMFDINPALQYGLDGTTVYIFATDNSYLVDIPVGNGFTDKWIMMQGNSASNKSSMDIDLTSYLSSKEALNRSPYLNIKLGSYFEAIDLNLLDFSNATTARTNNILNIKWYTSLVYPFLTNLELRFGGNIVVNRDIVFNLQDSMDIPYSTSQWADFYASNRQWATSGLATQQSHDRKALGVENAFNCFDMALNMVNPLSALQSPKTTKSGGLDKRYSRQNANISKSNNRAVTSAGLNVASGLLDMAGSYVQQDVQFAKEKAMQNIEFNDIKTSPNQVANSGASLAVKSIPYLPTIYITLYKAKNMKEIIDFHNKYGYRINRIENITMPIQKSHTNFDYIQLQDCELSNPLATDIRSSLVELFETGIRFWYNYDTMLDYSIPNNETT